MKKTIVWVLVAAICLSLCACGSEPEVLEPVPETEAKATLHLEPLAGNVAQVCTSYEHVAVLRTDGTVAAVGNNEKGQCEVSDWSGIVKIFAGDSGTMGLKEDGTVVSTWFDCSGWTNVAEIYFGSYGLAVGRTWDGRVLIAGTEDEDLLAAGQWTDIQEILVQYTDTIYGLKTDGTVVFAGLTHDNYNVYNTCQHCEISGWTKIERIFLYDNSLAGLRNDGSVVSSWPEVLDVSGWHDLETPVVTYPVYLGISEDGRLLTEGMLGLWTDGTFFLSQDHLYGDGSEHKVDLWDFTNLTQLVAWSPGGYIFGLKQDGSLAQVPRGTLDASQWNGIRELVDGIVWLAAIREDGTVLSWSSLEYSPDVSGWENVLELYTLSGHGYLELLGLRTDGTFIGTGDLAGWDLVRLTE